MKKNILLIIGICLSFLTFSQVNLLNRIEFEPKLDEFGHRIVTANDHGFLVYTLKKNKETEEETDANITATVKDKEDKTWEFIKYNERFEEEKRIEFGVPLDLFYATVFQDEHKIYFFYQHSLDEKRNDFLVLTIDIHTLSYQTFEGHLPPATIITRFYVTNDHVFVGGWEKKDPFMSLINLKNGAIRQIELSPDKGENYSVHSFSKANNGYVFVVLKGEKDKKEKQLEYRLQIYSITGIKEKEFILFKKDEGYFINNINIFHQEETNKYLVIGGYKSYKKDNLRGVYSMIIDKKSAQREGFNLYDFYDFEHFFDELEISQRNTKLPILKRSHAERDNINYLWSFHDIEQTSTGYLLIGEIYFPHFNKDKKAHFGNLYTHSILMNFNQKGELIWDNLYEIDIQNSVMTKKTFLAPTSQANNIQLLCYDEGNIKGANFEKGKKELQFQSSIGTGKDYEKILIHGDQELIHWFADYYLLSGQQRILNEKTKQERSVYFISCLKKGN